MQFYQSKQHNMAQKSNQTIEPPPKMAPSVSDTDLQVHEGPSKAYVSTTVCAWPVCV